MVVTADFGLGVWSRLSTGSSRLEPLPCLAQIEFDRKQAQGRVSRHSASVLAIAFQLCDLNDYGYQPCLLHRLALHALNPLGCWAAGLPQACVQSQSIRAIPASWPPRKQVWKASLSSTLLGALRSRLPSLKSHG